MAGVTVPDTKIGRESVMTSVAWALSMTHKFDEGEVDLKLKKSLVNGQPQLSLHWKATAIKDAT